jgi:DNA-binding response OmpR family regulator
VIRESSEPIDFSIWTPAWMETRESAQRAILRCGDSSLQPVLDALDAGWAALVAEESRSLAALPASADDGEAAAGPPVRLRIRVRDQIAMVDGEPRPVSEQPFKLLCLLARRATDDKGEDTFVEHRTIADHLWGKNQHKVSRPVRDVVRDLRKALEAGRAADRDAKSGSLVEVRHNVGYRLQLPPDEIVIED